MDDATGIHPSVESMVGVGISSLRMVQPRGELGELEMHLDKDDALQIQPPVEPWVRLGLDLLPRSYGWLQWGQFPLG